VNKKQKKNTGGGKSARLKEMKDKGLIESRAKRIVGAGEMPPVAVLDVIGPDDEGDLMARPSVWDEETQGPAPCILVVERKARPGRRAEPLPGAGDRVLARIQPLKSGPCPYAARVIRKLDSRANEILGVFRRNSRGGGGFIEPVEKKARGTFPVKPGDGGDARDGELVRAAIRRDRRHGVTWARVLERLGDVDDQRNISLIAIHEQGIRETFPEEAIRESENLKPFVHEGRRDIRHIPLVTIDPPDAREARLRGNSTYFPDRVVPMLPERISNDLCSLREGEDRPALACFMTFDRDGNRIRHRCAHGSAQTARPAGAGRAGAQADPRCHRTYRARRFSGAAGGPQADRRAHDPGQRLGGGDAGEEGNGIHLPHP